MHVERNERRWHHSVVYAPAATVGRLTIEFLYTNEMAFLIGVDEAGRGPLAGPVAVGCVMAPKGFDVAREFPGVRDSKKLSQNKREKIFHMLERRAKAGDVQFCVRFSGHAYIDERGIARAVSRAAHSGVRHLAPMNDLRGRSRDVHVLLDGLLQAPSEYSQETIIRGDDTVPLISLASIAAKVSRDRLMRKMAKKYPEYGFERHVGYATKVHRAAIERFGLTPIHRKTFCKNFSDVR